MSDCRAGVVYSAAKGENVFDQSLVVGRRKGEIIVDQAALPRPCQNVRRRREMVDLPLGAPPTDRVGEVKRQVAGDTMGK